MQTHGGLTDRKYSRHFFTSRNLPHRARLSVRLGLSDDRQVLGGKIRSGMAEMGSKAAKGRQTPSNGGCWVKSRRSAFGRAIAKADLTP